MKLRHFPAAMRHSPGFVLRHGLEMLAHTFTGTTLRSALGLEDERAVFERFRARRADQRREASGVPPDHARAGETQPRDVASACQSA
jgi:hypothetical protein